MIDPQNLNALFHLILNRNLESHRNPEIFREALDVMEKGVDKDLIPNDMIERLAVFKSLLRSIVDEGMDIDSAITNVVAIRKSNLSNAGLNVDNLISSIGHIRNKTMTDAEHMDIIKRVSDLFEWSLMIKTTPQVVKICKEIGDQNYRTITEYKKMTNELYISLQDRNLQIERKKAATNKSTLLFTDETTDGEITSLIKEIKDSSSKINRIPSGFELLDVSYLEEGFEKGRLYLFAAPPGNGKSTLLTTMFLNASLNSYEKKKKRIFLYITLELSRKESLHRILLSHGQLSQSQFNRTPDSNIAEIWNDISSNALNNNNIPVVEALVTEDISYQNVNHMCQKYLQKYEGSEIAAVFVDYLDILKMAGKKEHRHLVSETTKGLKKAAEIFGCPFIVATQVGRKGYTDTMDLDSLTDSSGKEQIADCVIMLRRSKTQENEVEAYIRKNRAGKTTISKPLLFKVDFICFKFISCSMKENPIDGSAGIEKFEDFVNTSFAGFGSMKV